MWHEWEQKSARCRKNQSEILEGKKKEEGEEGNVEGVRVSREWGRHDLTPKHEDTLSPQDHVFPHHFHLQRTPKAHVSRCLVPFPQGKPSHRNLGLAKKNTNLKILAQELFQESDLCHIVK